MPHRNKTAKIPDDQLKAFIYVNIDQKLEIFVPKDDRRDNMTAHQRAREPPREADTFREIIINDHGFRELKDLDCFPTNKKTIYIPIVLLKNINDYMDKKTWTTDKEKSLALNLLKFYSSS